MTRDKQQCVAPSNRKKLENVPEKQQKNTERQETKEEIHSSRQELPCTGREKDEKYTEPEERIADKIDARAGGSEIGGFDKAKKSRHWPFCILEDDRVPPFPNEPARVSEEGSPNV